MAKIRLIGGRNNWPANYNMGWAWIEVVPAVQLLAQSGQVVRMCSHYDP